MEDKLHDFFSENNFDVHEPHSGHLERFQRKLQQPKRRKLPWKWMSVAACFVLSLGFWLGSNQQKNQLDLGDMPNMQETQNYFVNAINFELKNVEKHRSLDTESLIEEALEELEDLEDSYKEFIKDLNENGYNKQTIYAMIENYQQRLEILENLLQQIEELKKPAKINQDETYI